MQLLLILAAHFKANGPALSHAAFDSIGADGIHLGLDFITLAPVRPTATHAETPPPG
ncbi:hypothetical protein [Paraburkholderia bonniea]|uniref:hypothetical protein n=1 Tax=Paraburkholderia bonniea TaxID=2152891 RepID=UPI0012908D68|nr:hypothetical protein [Paraburkholderia bonniea]